MRPKRYDDRRVQTLLYRDQLEARARRLRSDARLAIEESGTNILFLAFGFLEWSDERETGRSHLAPLILVPVELTRVQGNGRARWQLTWTGEDLEPNLSLARKLEQARGLSLPELTDPGDGETYLRPEAYFRVVRELVAHIPGWTVRRFATLALFHFGKLLLYRDLDPARWPAGQRLEEHPLIRRLFGGGATTEPSDAVISDRERLEAIDLDLPLVDRADGSQAAALLRALRGETMLIEGPPGTGKSQTITNLIAAALAAGRTVLFVSEKLAALEVVRRRMDALGLGELCLELHSHKTRKRGLLDDIARSLQQRRALPGAPDLPARLGRLRALRAELEAYGALLRQPVGALALPLHEALYRAGRLRQEVRAHGLAPEPLPELEAVSVTSNERAEALRVLGAFAAALDRLAGGGIVARHPWAGVSSHHLFPADAERAVSAVRAWRDAAQEVRAAVAALEHALEAPLGDDLEGLRALADGRDRLRRLPELQALATAAAASLSSVTAVLQITPTYDPAGLNLAARIIDLAAAAPRDALSLRSGELVQEETGTVVAELARRIEAYRASLRSLEGVVRLPLPELDPLALRTPGGGADRRRPGREAGAGQGLQAGAAVLRQPGASRGAARGGADGADPAHHRRRRRAAAACRAFPGRTAPPGTPLRRRRHAHRGADPDRCLGGPASPPAAAARPRWKTLVAARRHGRRRRPPGAGRGRPGAP